MSGPNEGTDVCCACGADLPDESQLAFVNFRYQVPGEGPERVLVAACCDKCAKEADDPALFPVIEGMINARIIRIERPDMKFKP